VPLDAQESAVFEAGNMRLMDGRAADFETAIAQLGERERESKRACFTSSG
jgi:hypothetical protein